MDHFLMQVGGAVGAATGVIHGYLGEKKLFALAKIEPPYARQMARLGWQCGAVAWVAMGVLLVFAAGFQSPDARRAVIAASVIVYLTGAVGNAMATKGRHFGWAILALTIGLVQTGW